MGSCLGIGFGYRGPISLGFGNWVTDWVLGRERVIGLRVGHNNNNNMITIILQYH